mgnify:CR=1 FL=1
MDIKAVRKKIEGLTPREKIVSVLVIIALAIFIFNVLLYSPASKKARTRKETMQNLSKEVEAIASAVTLQASEKKPAAEKIDLPQAEDLSGMLAAISREANIANVDFISISPEGLEQKDRFVELRLKMELRVKFRELYDFLRNIESRHRLFLVQNIRFETNSTVYPSGIAVLNAVTYLRKKE